MLSSLKDTLSSFYSRSVDGISSLFGAHHIDDGLIERLEEVLIRADVGPSQAHALVESVRSAVKRGDLERGDDMSRLLSKQMTQALELNQDGLEALPEVVVLVGVNGTGKTSFAGKLASHCVKERGEKVLLVAADTFRAAAMEQLERWALRVGSDIHLGRQGMDPSAVIFDGCKKFLSGDYDRLIIDTAGRVQTKIHLMQELEKMCRVARKLVGEKSLGTWLVLDATLGCNTLDQARLFSGIAPLNGLVLTKVDGSGKAGAIFSVSQELSLPIAYVSHGERDEDISPFSVDEYVRGIFHGA